VTIRQKKKPGTEIVSKSWVRTRSCFIPFLRSDGQRGKLLSSSRSTTTPLSTEVLGPGLERRKHRPMRTGRLPMSTSKTRRPRKRFPQEGGPAHTRFPHRRGSGAGPNRPRANARTLGRLNSNPAARSTCSGGRADQKHKTGGPAPDSRSCSGEEAPGLTSLGTGVTCGWLQEKLAARSVRSGSYEMRPGTHSNTFRWDRKSTGPNQPNETG